MRPPRAWPRRLQSLLGAAAIVAGAWLLCPAAAVIVLGVLLLVDAIT